MIVWGGIGVSHFNTGGKYNPGTNSWTATTTSNAPHCSSFSDGRVDEQRNDRLGRAGRRRSGQYWREILRTIRCANANANCIRNSHADSDSYSNVYANPMHGEMYTNAATAPYSGAPPVRCE